MRIQAKKIPKQVLSADDTLARFCYYFQQYTYEQAKRLPYKRIVKMLSVAKKEEAHFMYQLANIAAAPHSKNGSGVKKLLKHYSDILSN